MTEISKSLSNTRARNRIARLLQNPPKGADAASLRRQCSTALNLLSRFKKQGDGGRQLLADDPGMGKTLAAAIVAWKVAITGGRVFVLAPNKRLVGTWIEALEEKALAWLGNHSGKVRVERFEQGRYLMPGQIFVGTHRDLIKPAKVGASETKRTGNLLIVDEAHRARNETSKLRESLEEQAENFDNTLILTATPMSIAIEGLIGLLQLDKSDDQEAAGQVRKFKKLIDRLHELPEEVTSEDLLGAGIDAISAMKPLLIRHTIEGLPDDQKPTFGKLAERSWDIKVPAASSEEIECLLRADRLFRLRRGRQTEDQNAGATNDPRFHVGRRELREQLVLRPSSEPLPPEENVHREALLKFINDNPAHPKVTAVVEAVAAKVKEGEKVLIFAHHHATCDELTEALQTVLGEAAVKRITDNPDEKKLEDDFNDIASSLKVLVASDAYSEGIDLHKACRHLVHFELDPSPIRTLQRNGRIRRIESYAGERGLPIEIAYPFFRGTRDERLVETMERRLRVFAALLGGSPEITQEELESSPRAPFSEPIATVLNELLSEATKEFAAPPLG